MKFDMTDKLFCCYSAPLKAFLKERGIRYEICAVHPKSNQMFWVYIHCKALDDALRLWKS